MVLVLKYSKFYRWQLLVGLIMPLGIVIFIIPEIMEQGISISGLIIIGFCIFVIIYCLILYSQRIRDFIELQVDDKGLRAIYRKERCIEIEWKNISEVLSEEKRRGKLIKIISKKETKEIVVNSEVNDFDLLIEEIRKYTKIDVH